MSKKTWILLKKILSIGFFLTFGRFTPKRYPPTADTTRPE